MRLFGSVAELSGAGKILAANGITCLAMDEIDKSKSLHYIVCSIMFHHDFPWLSLDQATRQFNCPLSDQYRFGPTLTPAKTVRSDPSIVTSSSQVRLGIERTVGGHIFSSCSRNVEMLLLRTSSIRRPNGRQWSTKRSIFSKAQSMHGNNFARFYPRKSSFSVQVNTLSLSFVIIEDLRHARSENQSTTIWARRRAQRSLWTLSQSERLHRDDTVPERKKGEHNGTLSLANERFELISSIAWELQTSATWKIHLYRRWSR